jgi:hypothetical protein
MPTGVAFDFPWQDGIVVDTGTLKAELPPTRLKLVCTRTTKRVHAAGALPAGLCTPHRHWTGIEQDLAGWWCDDPNQRLLLGGGGFFAQEPGVERVSVVCCPPEGDACDGWDGGLRALK